MKKLVAILLVALMIGITPAFAAEVSVTSQTVDPMDVKGKGVDAEAASQITEQIESGKTVETNNETSNITMDTSSTSTEQNTTTNDDQVTESVDTPTQDLNTNPDNDSTVTDNETNTAPELNTTSGPEQLLSVTLDFNITENETNSTPELNTTGIVMQTTNYTCGPAALATVLNNMGINVTEQELATLAGTDENGTTMYGLVQAAKAKGLNAVGMKLSVNELKKNNIVFLTIDGTTHYSVVREVTNESVYLADPSLGNIEMTREKFSEAYSGNALVISDPNAMAQEVSNSTQATGTSEQLNNETNQTSGNTISSELVNNTTNVNSTNGQSENNKTLTNEEMQSVKGKNWKYRLNKRLKREGRWNRNAWYNRGLNWWRVYYGGAWVCVAVGYTNHPAGKLFGFLGTAYLGTVGNSHVNEGWWTYT